MHSPKLTAKVLTIHDLSTSAQQLLFEKATRIELTDQDFLLKEDEICKRIWFVESGCVKLANNKDGKEINLNFCIDGEFITDLKSLRLGTPTDNYIKSCGPSIVIGFTKDDLLELYQQSDEIGTFGRLLLEQLLSDQEEHANLFKLKTAAERYQYIVTTKPVLLQRITLTQLASYLGMSRETLTRVRQLK